ncbi:MAG: GldG family protein [Chloroflexi bacterium]|nr:GldG family protein [Chloroflexota bacterium]
MNRAVLRQIGSWAGFLIVPLLIAGAIYFVTYGKFDLPLIIDLLILAVAAILYASTNPLTLRNQLGTQILGSSLSAIVVCIAAVGIIVLVNILMQRVTVRTDLTTTQQFSVSNATIEVLKKLKEPVKVTVFYTSDPNSGGDSARLQIEDRLKEYTSRTDKLNVTYIDANTDPAKVRQYNITALPTTVFEQSKQREMVTSSDEQEFTRAILRVQSNIQRRVFFITGHNERPIQLGSNGDSLSQAVQALKDNNYLVDTLNLFNFSTSGTITNTTNPNEAITLNPATDVLVFGAPRGPINETEKQKALTFLKQGGKALFLEDPLASMSTVPVERRDNVNDLLKEWNLKFSAGIAIEQDPQRRSSSNPTIFLTQASGSSGVLRNLPDIPIVIAQATQVENTPSSSGSDTGTFTPLLQTSVNSYLKTDIQNIGQSFDQSKDVRGPITIAASFEIATPITGTQNLNTRLVLVSNYLFASDQPNVGLDPASGSGNYFFFLNTINWLSESSDSVVIAPRQTNSHPFAINQGQGSFLFWSTFLGLPALVLFVGITVWWRRR